MEGGFGWLSLAPPLLAILLALALRQVYLALLGGVWLGAWIVSGGGIHGLLIGALRTFDKYIVGALADSDHVSIILFSLMLGGMVGVMSRSGGTTGLVNALSRKATTSGRGQLVTWVLGVAVFFDDYANTLVVGNTMRPITDKLKISREKLAYIVDSTAAPVAAIALLSTWIGYEISLIGDALAKSGSDLDPYAVFLQSIPYNFYPLLALAFGLMIAGSRRDFGPMLKAERRARKGELLRKGAQPLSDFDSHGLLPVEGKPHRWTNAVIPLAIVIHATFIAQWFTGRAAMAEAGHALADTPFFKLGMQGIGTVFSEGNSFHALLWAAALGSVVAIAMVTGQGVLKLQESLDAWLNGIKSMLPAMIILVLAWAIASVCKDLNTAGFVTSLLSDKLNPNLLPSLMFLCGALIAFSTGTSWATMGILLPLAVPIAFGVTAAAGFGEAAAHQIFLATTSAVLAGAIFGDHCSPISDTTVMSSMSSGCDHVDHVRTQLPYALTVALAALITGYLPVAAGLPVWAGLLLGVAVLGAVVRFVGKPVEG
ncbi:MAG: Na+/H+ antiporter NhaC family protein [Acidobacteria bacterium]|uniref:Na+/H+ antiporter NhaC family protein n=1 Tax=Candidatus Polarisedimenticola svalbardensis TaxID=2886004 RepID=A0A8J6Y8F7_9BACT|nr:Na+/H+ antiporter NhaC family protein [Candidatus Polarisedimenticola svalbardensis]